MPNARLTSLTATVFESEKSLSDEAIRNTQAIRQAGGRILCGVDAARLDKHFSHQKFDTIIFQFPNVGSRESKYGHTSNHVLIRRFLRSAALYLDKSGEVLITIVDNPYYQGAFKFDEAAAFAGYKATRPYPFDPSMFPGYAHVNTNDDDSALESYNRFTTWVFKLK